MVFNTNQCGKILNPAIQNIILPQIGLAQEIDLKTFRRQRCFDTMIQNIILPQIGLAQEIDLKRL